MFIVGFLQLYYIFLRFKRVETFIGGGGGGGGGGGEGGVQLFFFFFFFFWGVQILISIETYITCDFSGGGGGGGGGGSGPPIPFLDSRMGKK